MLENSDAVHSARNRPTWSEERAVSSEARSPPGEDLVIVRVVAAGRSLSERWSWSGRESRGVTEWDVNVLLGIPATIS